MSSIEKEEELSLTNYKALCEMSDKNIFGETSKAHKRRLKEGWFDKYAPEDKIGIDIGSKSDPLNQTFRRYDLIFGDSDATYMEGIKENTFFTVYCLSINTPILTKKGFKLIQNVCVGDEVWTHNKRWKKVIGNNKFISEHGTFRIKTVGNSEGLIGTCDHPINVKKINKHIVYNEKIFNQASLDSLDFLKMEDISQKDLSVCPIPDTVENIDSIDLFDVLAEDDKIHLYKEVLKTRCNNKVGDKTLAKQFGVNPTLIRGWIYHNKKPFGYYHHENHIEFNSTSSTFKIPRFLKVDSDLLRLLGYFLSDGSLYSGGSVKHSAFHFNATEQEYIEDVKNIIIDKFNIYPTDIKKNKDVDMIVIRYANSTLYKIFYNLFCDKKCRNKSIPDWALWIDPKLQMDLIEGFFRGDGTVNENVMSLATVSNCLAEGLKLCLLRNGVFALKHKVVQKTSSILTDGRKIEGCGFRYVICWTLNRKTQKGGGIFNGMIVSRIKSIEMQENPEEVFGIQVEDDESYYACGIMNHNCSHVLEHLQYPEKAIKNWYRILKPGGHLIINVPHRDLYERKQFPPSNWNVEHVYFWLPDSEELPSTKCLKTIVLSAIPNANIVEYKVLDQGFDYSISENEHAKGEYSIECIIRK